LISRKPAAVLLILLATALEALGQKAQGAPAAELAATPPMGWNSWDGYGTTITEAQFKANASWIAQHLKRFGWQYVVLDMEWFVTNPTAEGNSKSSQYSLDQYGRYTPAPNRFPSAANGQGFHPLADYVHSLGLKFGIHILRGIPKQALEKNLPISGSSYRASDAADRSDTCPWNFDNYGVDASKPAGQAYYASIAQLYAGWGVDFLKVDCISSHPYKGDEIRLLSTALRNTGRPIVLSLSPGPAPTEKIEEMRKYAAMWRISNDIWDLWHNDKEYPKGVGDQFGNVAKWAGLSEPGHWPDADMLPVGYLGPAPGWGKPRNTRLTQEEQKTLITLWSIFRSPLMVGGDLTAADSWTTALLTNSEVLDLDQHSTENRVVISKDQVVVWSAKSRSRNDQYVAVFNTGSDPLNLHYEWKELGLREAAYRVRDVWRKRDLGSLGSITVPLPTHACVLYRLSAK